MNIQRSTLRAILLGALLTCAIVGCGRSPDAAPAPAPAPPAADASSAAPAEPEPAPREKQSYLGQAVQKAESVQGLVDEQQKELLKQLEP